MGDSASRPLIAPFQTGVLPPYFVGRVTEISALKKSLVRADQNSIYALIGMAGVGKSNLAAKIAYELKDEFADGVLWARLDRSDTMSILASFAAAYDQDVSQILDLDSRSQIVRGMLGQKRVLIILDNAESSEQVVPLLPPIGRCATVVTTRRHDLTALTGAKRFEIAPFSADKSDSLALFKQILDDRLVGKTPELFSKIADSLGHLPLALRIAASRLAYEPGWDIYQFTQQIQALNQRLHLLKFESKSLMELFQISFDLLDPNLKKIFTTIGLLGKQSFSIETVSALSGLGYELSADGLRQLHSLSLVLNHRHGRYDVHPLVFDFAQSLPNQTSAEDASIAYWITFTTQHKHAFELLEVEINHIEAAISFAFKREMFSSVVKLLHHLMPFFSGRGLLGKTENYLSRVKPSLEKIESNKELAIVLLHLGQINRQYQKLNKAEQDFKTGLKVASRLKDHVLAAKFLTELGIIENCRHQYENGKNYLLQAMSQFDASHLNSLPLSLFEELGILALIENELAEAHHYFQQGFDLAQVQKNDAQVVLFLKGLGSVHYLKQQFQEASKFFRQGYLLAQRINFLKGKMILSNNLGVMAFYTDELANAKDQLQVALVEANRLNDDQSKGIIKKNLEVLQAGDNGRLNGERPKIFI